MDYMTINGEYEAILEIKKSIFISRIINKASVEEVNEYYEKIKKTEYKATHNTYAYILKEDSSIKKAYDDGEPSQTAGKPILNVLERNELTNTLLIVTRYFGGVKLGASGLIRAYSDSAIKAVEMAEKICKIYCRGLKIIYAYPMHGKIERYFYDENYFFISSDFLENVVTTIYVPISLEEKLKTDLTLATNAKVEFLDIDYKYMDKKIKIEVEK